MKDYSFLDHPAFMWACRALLVAALACLVWASAASHWGDMIALTAIALVIGATLYAKSKLPSFLGFMLAVAATVNGAGYALQLWHDETLFDEIVHAFTTFAGMAAIGWSLRDNDRFAGSTKRLLSSVVAIGLALGVLWEILEWAIGIIGRPKDTAIDLLMDCAGAAAAGLMLCRIRSNARND